MHMNFFSIHLEQQRQAQRKRRMNMILIVLLIVAIGSGIGYLVYATSTFEQRIAAAQKILLTPENVAFEKEISDTDKAISAIDSYRRELQQIETAFASRVKVDKAALDSVMASLPEGTALTSISLSGYNLRLTGTIGGAYLAPSLLANLRATDLFVDIAPISLLTESGALVFNVSCVLKGGALQ